MNIQILQEKYNADWKTYLGSKEFTKKALKYKEVLGKSWSLLKPKYMFTDMIVYNIEGHQHQKNATDLLLIAKVMSKRPAGYTYVDKTWLVLYTLEWADYLHTVLNVPVDNIWVLCECKEREDVCKLHGYNVIHLTSVSRRNKKGKPILDARTGTWKKIMKNFDNVVGNPPFAYDDNPNFYIEFIKISQKILKEGGYFDFVIPNRFLNPKTNAAKSLNKWLEATYVMPSVNHYFNIGTEVGVVGGIARAKPNFNVIPYDFDNGTVINRSLKNISPLVNVCPESISIVDKVVNTTFHKMKIVSKETLLDHYIYIKVMYERWSPLKSAGGPHRFSALINDVDDQVGHKVGFTSYEEANVNEWFMTQSKLGRFLTYSFAAIGFSTSSLVHAGDMPSLPVTVIDNNDLVITHNGSQLSVVLCDQFFYNLFNLSSDERKYIEDKMLSLDSKKERSPKKKAK